jgi:beta-galactosidase
VLHLSPHWNWKGTEGRGIPVTCHTNCDTVELFPNGRSLATKGYAFFRPGMEERWGNMPARARALRTTADDGEIRIKASSPGLKSGSAIIVAT